MGQTLFSVIVEVSLLGQTLWRQLPSIEWALIAHNLCCSLPSQCNSTAYSQHISDLEEAFLFRITARCTRNDFRHRGIYGVGGFAAASTLQGFQVSKSLIVPKSQKSRKRLFQYVHSSPAFDKLKPKAAASKNCISNSASGLLLPLFSDVHVLFLLLRIHSVPAALTYFLDPSASWICVSGPSSQRIQPVWNTWFNTFSVNDHVEGSDLFISSQMFKFKDFDHGRRRGGGGSYSTQTGLQRIGNGLSSLHHVKLWTNVVLGRKCWFCLCRSTAFRVAQHYLKKKKEENRLNMETTIIAHFF